MGDAQHKELLASYGHAWKKAVEIANRLREVRRSSSEREEEIARLSQALELFDAPPPTRRRRGRNAFADPTPDEYGRTCVAMLELRLPS